MLVPYCIIYKQANYLNDLQKMLIKTLILQERATNCLKFIYKYRKLGNKILYIKIGSFLNKFVLKICGHTVNNKINRINVLITDNLITY